MTLSPSARGWVDPCPDPGHNPPHVPGHDLPQDLDERETAELAWLWSQPLTGAYDAEVERIAAKTDPEVTAAFEAIQRAREVEEAAKLVSDTFTRKMGSEQGKHGSVPDNSYRSNRPNYPGQRPCAKVIWRRRRGRSGVRLEAISVPCNTKRCPHCGWTDKRQGDLLRAVGDADRLTLAVIDEADWPRISERLKKRRSRTDPDLGWLPIPVAGNQRLVITETHLEEGESLDTGEALRQATDAIRAVPLLSREDDRRVRFGGTWEARAVDGRPKHDQPEGVEEVIGISPAGVTLEDVAFHAGSLGGIAAPVTPLHSDPEGARCVIVAGLKPLQESVLMRRCRMHTIDEQVELRQQRRWETDFDNERDRIKAIGREMRGQAA
jgi:hypothetical protein